MKNFVKIFMAVAVAMSAFSCVTDTTEDLAVKVGGKTTLTLSLENTCTQLGEAVDGVYPVTWSEGDQITVNGVTSDPLAAADAGTANAVFTFNTENLSAPYCVAYPAAEANQVIFAAEQEYVDGTFANGAAALYGYGEEESNLTLNHLTGVLKIGVVCGEDVDLFDAPIIQSVKISTIDSAPIAGAFDIDFATGDITPTAESTSVINYSIDEKLSQDPTYIHVTVPAGIYNELYVTLEDRDGGVMYATVTANDKKPLLAGRVREFSAPIVYTPINSGNVFVVKDYDSFVAFTTAAAAGTSKAPVTKNAVFVGDVEIPSTGWTSVSAEYYTGTICGNGHIISGANNPLFSKLGATVKGLHLTNVNIETSGGTLQNVGALVNDYKGECITHCSASGTITQKDFTGKAAKRFGGIIGNLSNASSDVEISYCVNRCTLNFGGKAGGDNDHSTASIGGVLGNISSASGSKTLTFKGNVNEGDINVTGPNGYFSTRTAGVAGYMGRFKYIDFEDCVNKGNITFSLQVNTTLNYVTYIAGVVCDITSNSDDRIYTVKNCENLGKVTVCSSRIQRGLMTGGVVGVVALGGKTSMTLENLTNSAEVSIDVTNCSPDSTADYAADGFSNIVGGVLGATLMRANATFTVKNVKNNSKVYCSGYSSFFNSKTTTNSYTWVFAGGIIGKMEENAGLTPTYNFDGLVNTGNVEVSIGAKGVNGSESYFGALIGKCTCPSITNAKHIGTFKVYQRGEDDNYTTYPNAGFLTGSEGCTFTNSAVGGTFVYGDEGVLKYEHLVADNYAKYLFGNRNLTEYAGVSLLTTVPVTADQPEVFDRDSISLNYVSYRTGNLPIIISVPHGSTTKGGTVNGVELVKREKSTTKDDNSCDSGFSTALDSRTMTLATLIEKAIYRKTGKYPYMVIATQSRTYIDFNRHKECAIPYIDGAYATANEISYDTYHGLATEASAEIEKNFGAGILFDIHGHGHSVQQVEIGYLTKSYELAETDETLMADEGYVKHSSIYSLAKNNKNNLSFVDLIRGEFSFGDYLFRAGLACVPYSGKLSPGTSTYYNGGYITKSQGSRDESGGTVDAIQLEFGSTARASDRLAATAEAAATAIIEYVKKHYAVTGLD